MSNDTTSTTFDELRGMYEARHREVSRVIDARQALGGKDGRLTDDERRIWERYGEHIEYLFGCLDGLRNAMHVLDPEVSDGWRDLRTWEASLTRRGARL